MVRLAAVIGRQSRYICTGTVRINQVFSRVEINSGIFQPENKYGIFILKNKYCIYFCAGQRVDSDWTEQVDRVDRGLSTWPKESSVISVGYHLLFLTLSSIATWKKFSDFLSAWNPVLFSL